MPPCASCGNEILATSDLCEHCGAPGGSSATEVPKSPQQQQAPAPLMQQPFIPDRPPSPEYGGGHTGPEPVGSSLPEPVSAAADQTEPPQQQSPANRWDKQMLAVAVLVVLLVLAFTAVLFIQRPGGAVTGTAQASPPFIAPAAAMATPLVTTPVVEGAATTGTPQVPDPFVGAYPLREWFSYNEGKYASRATVYRTWMNGTYQWHNDDDNRYYTQRPKAGNKYLFVYVVIENMGTDPYPYPKSSMISVHYGGSVFLVDSEHYTPDKAEDRDARAVGILEIWQQPDFFNSEHVEDFGFSHGTMSDFIYPGQSNAIDGYLIYEVPESLSPEKTYLEILFDGGDRAVWKLG